MANSEASSTSTEKEFEAEVLSRNKSDSIADPVCNVGDLKGMKDERHMVSPKLEQSLFGLAGFGQNDEQSRMMNGQAINLALDFNGHKSKSPGSTPRVNIHCNFIMKQIRCDKFDCPFF